MLLFLILTPSLIQSDTATQTHTSITFNSTKMGSKLLFVRVNTKSSTIFVDSETGHTFKMKNRFPFAASHVYPVI